MWCTTGIVAIMAVRLAGIGVAQSLWSGIGSELRHPITHDVVCIRCSSITDSGNEVAQTVIYY